MRSRLLALTLALSILISGNAMAWGPLGHRAVAAIAVYILKVKVHANFILEIVKHILNSDENGKDLGSNIGIQQIASFADDMRANPDFDCIKDLHFTSVPLSVSSYTEYIAQNPHQDVVMAIVTLMQFLQSGDSTVFSKVPGLDTLNKNPRTVITKSLALKLLVHFVGDLYQPLHMVGDDWGGNGVKVSIFGVVSNLHSVIDSVLKEQLDARDFIDDNINEITTNEFLEEWKISLYDAANQTLALRKTLYDFPDGTKSVILKDKNGVDLPPQDIPVIGDKYILANKQILRTQVQKSGIMVARILMQVLDPVRTLKSKYAFPDVLGKGSCDLIIK